MKVLFFHPRRESVTSRLPHAGLGYLAGSLGACGHEVKVVDYVAAPDAPVPESFLSSFNPDVVGISMYTACHGEGMKIVETVHRLAPQLPILLGGPYTAFYADELAQDKRIHAIVTGEAESTLPELLDNLQNTRGIVRGEPAGELDKLPPPDLTAFWGYEKFREYSLLSSRGCPYSCSFCEVRTIISKKWRKRSVESCIEEITHVGNLLPSLTTVVISDDCPTLNLVRFKNLLRSYIRMRFPYELRVENLRADRIDKEAILLMRRAHADSICFGAEHGHPDVFDMINKGESQADIIRSAAWVRDAGLSLRLCFIVGLPGDSYKKSAMSIKLARSLKAGIIFWNMITPLKGSPMRTWFEEHGKIYDERDHTSLVGNACCDDPCVETRDFPKSDMTRAYLRAVIATDQYSLSLKGAKDLLRESIEKGLVGYLAASICRKSLKKAQALAMRFVISATRAAIRLLAGSNRFPAITDSRSHELTLRRFKTALRELISQYPLSPSMCLWRAKEVVAMEQLNFLEPVLDLGCGDGGMAEVMLPGYELHGLDLDPEALKVAAHRGNYKSLARADVSNLPYPDNFFGSVITNCVAEHVDDPDALLKEAGRVLKPGGILAMTVPSERFKDLFSAKMLLEKTGMAAKGEKVLEWYNNIQKHKNMNDAATWKSRLERAGLTNIDSRPIVEPETALLFSAIDLIWLSPLPWGLGKNSGRAGSWIAKWGNIAGAGRWKNFWYEFMIAVSGYLPAKPVTGAGILITATKPS